MRLPIKGAHGASLSPAWAGARVRCAAVLLTALALHPAEVLAQQGGLRPGEAFVTRFSGVTTAPGPQGAVPAIDPQGTVGSILDLRNPGRPPEGRHWLNEPQRAAVTAQQVGQVFGVALDDARPPNIYLTATSAFGLHRTPDNRDWMPGMWGAGGPGAIYRLDAASGYQPRLFARIAVEGRANTGAALGNIAFDRVNRQFFVSDLETGMIHRIGLDGADRGFYDHAGRARLGFTEPGENGRKSLRPIAFPPDTRAQVRDCQPLTRGGRFETSPECWNFAPSGRRVWGLGVAQLGPSEVRLFYAVASGPAFGEEGWTKLPEEEKRNTIWSVRIGPDGAPDESDLRREAIVPDFFQDEEDIARAGYSHPVSDISFPSCGTDRPVMLVAERGGIRNLGLGADNPFAAPHESRVIRYELDGSGAWQPIGRYDIGFYDRSREGPPHMRANCAGGAAFGPAIGENGWRADPGQPDRYVWITGDALCSPDGPCNAAGGRAQAPSGRQPPRLPPPQRAAAPPAGGDEGDPSEVHGVQGLAESAFDELQPGGEDEPKQGQQGGGAPPVGPTQAYLVDADINVDASGRPIEEELARNDATMIGDIAIHQECAPPAAGRPAYMIPPPLAPPVAWPAFGNVHPTHISHARYASHGRRLSHFRFGSHSLDISHHRWQSHWPRISHDRRRSHYRWYSQTHVRPLSPGHTRRLSPGHLRPLSPGHSRRLSPPDQHVRPMSPGHNRFTSPGHLRPLSPGHSRPASRGHARPLSPGHTRILSPGGGHLRAVSVTAGHRRGLSPGAVRPQHHLAVSRRATARPLHSPALSRRTIRPGPAVGPRRVGPSRVVPSRVGPGRVGPGRVGPSRVGPGRMGPGRVGPGRVGPSRIGPPPRAVPRAGPAPGRFGPGRAGPAQVAPGRAGPGPDRAAPRRPGPDQPGRFR